MAKASWAKASGAKARGLSQADLQLWAAFSQTILLLPGKIRLAIAPEPETPITPAIVPPPVVKPVIKAQARQVAINHAPPGVDKSSWRKFATGRVRAVSRLDLHGMTAVRAHHAVTHFIERAYTEQNRCVEIITGKGEILVHELPHWLNAPNLRPMILALAHPHAANTGSVRVLIRRMRVHDPFR